MPPVNSQLNYQLRTLENEGKIYEATLEYQKHYKESEHSKIANVMYGLVAVAVFAIFSESKAEVNFINKFVLVYSIIFTLLSYYWWFLVDALILHTIFICNCIMANNKSLQYEVGNGILINQENPFFRKIEQLKPFLESYNRINKKFSWACLLSLICAGSLVVLGLFWSFFNAPSYLIEAISGHYQSIFYCGIFAAIIIIIACHIFYYCLATQLIRNANK